MKKNILMLTLGAIFLAIGDLWSARQGDIGDPMYFSQASSSAAVYGVSCATYTGTQLDSSSYAVLVGTRAFVRIQNHDATANVYIGFSVNVSTISTESDLGEKIAPSGSATYYLTQDVPIYCKSDAASATRISVLQLYYK